MEGALLCCSVRTRISINWATCHHHRLHRPYQCLSVSVYFARLEALQFLVPFSKFIQFFYFDKIFIPAVQYMAKLFHMPIFQERWFLPTLAHVFTTFWVNNTDILGVIELLYPGAYQSILYKRKSLGVQSCQQLGWRCLWCFMDSLINSSNHRCRSFYQFF